MSWWAWLLVTVVLLIGELLTTGFFLFWFALGAVGATLTALFTPSLPVQVLVFILVSAALLFSSRRLTEKMSADEIDTNVHALVGKTALVTADILPHQKGQAKINSEEWTCVVGDNSSIKAGTLVEVTAIQGVTLTVAPVNTRKVG